MKRTITFLLCFAIGFAVYAQTERIKIPSALKKKCRKFVYDYSIEEPNYDNTAVSYNNFENYKDGDWTEDDLGESRYDLQTNGSMQHRIYLFEDGTIGSTWTRGMQETSFPDRGTGYNFYDGTSWGEFPTERIESLRCGWPAIAPLGSDGEMVVSHTANTNGLCFNTRATRGIGDWTEFLFIGPSGHEKIEFPRIVTNGDDHDNVHIIYITAPEHLSGSPYMGMDGALLYSRSLDGGQTWDIEHEQLPGITSNEFTFLYGDLYCFAEPKGETLAFIYGSKWYDMFLMKSDNNGEDWDKTLIWEHPYPMFDFDVTVTDTFYTCDGMMSVALDSEGMAHVVFGITRVGHFTVGDTYTHFYFTDGLAYWNEDMPTFSNGINTLCPYEDPESELIEDYNLIGWAQDINGNGTWDIIGGDESIGSYRGGVSSMPQLVIDDEDNAFVLFSSVTETFQTSEQNYRHLWIRVSMDKGETWNDEFIDLTGDVGHIFSECIWPSMSATSDDYLHIVYQEDNEPGMAQDGDEDPWGDNTFPYINIPKPEVIGVEENNTITTSNSFVTQNYPNPARTTTRINVHLTNPAYLTLEVYNTTGERVMAINNGYTAIGVHSIDVDVSGLSSGVYFYTVKAGNNSGTYKMLVE